MAIKKKVAKKAVAEAKKPSKKAFKPVGNPFQTGLYAKLEEWMRKSPTKLIDKSDASKQFKVDLKSAANSLAYLYKHGKIKRHATEGSYKSGFKYAIDIPAADSVPYTSKSIGVKVFSGSNAIQGAFVQLQNALARLEEDVVSIANERDKLKIDNEEMRRNLMKVNKVLKQIGSV